MKKLFAMLLCVAMFAMGGAALAEDAMLTALGTGTVLVQSDQAIISIGVREVAGDVIKAQGTVNEKIEAVRQALLALGVKESEISTSSIGIYANYDYSGVSEVISGYTAYNTLSVKSDDTENIGALIDAAFAAGANSLDNVQFALKDGTAAQDEALKLAVEDAMRKSTVLAEAAGLSIKAIDSITEVSGYNYYDGTGIYRAAVSEDAAAGTSVQAAQVTVTASVTIEFDAE